MNFIESLHTRRILADGAMGSELQKRGLPLYTSADQWSLSHPNEVLAVHQAYVAAGCEIVLTNTLTANSTTYPADHADAINRAAAGLARQSGARWVAGSMGPGADEQQARALAEAGVDIFWLETQLSVAQVVESIVACRHVSTTIPIIVTFSFHQPTAITQTGETIHELVKNLATYDICALGANCGNAFLHISTIVEYLSTHTTLPIVLKPNAGIPTIENSHMSYQSSIERWVSDCTDTFTAKNGIVGGCCGTSPAHLRALYDSLT